MSISGGGTPNTDCEMPFHPVSAEFNHWKYLNGKLGPKLAMK